MTPLLYLEIRQFVNTIKNTTRSPKRLIPVLVIAAWFLHSVMSLIIDSGVHSNGPDISIISRIPSDLLETGVFLFLCIGSVLVMYGAFSSGLMIFSIAHIDFLFPTPISHRNVLLIKLIKDYLKFGFYVAVFFAMIGFPVFRTIGVQVWPSGLVSVSAVTALLITVVNISHTINIVFTFGFERFKQAGFLIKSALIIIPLSALLVGIIQLSQTGNMSASFVAAVKSPVMAFAFAPMRWCARLFLAPLLGVTAEEMFRLWALWLLSALSFIVLISRKENIYEPSIGVSVKNANRRAAMRIGDYAGMRTDELREKGAKRALGIAIPPFGKGAVALLWKGLVVRCRISATQLLVMFALPSVMVLVISSLVPDKHVLKYLPLLLLYVISILSMITPAELRSELKHANILKPMPIAGWKIMLAQAVNSTIYLTFGILVFAFAMEIIAPESRLVDANRGSLMGACLILSPFLGFVNISASLISAVLYPDFRDPAQSYLGSLVSFVLIAIAVAPSAILISVMIAIYDTSFRAAAIAASGMNVLIGLGCVGIAGMLFRRYDPTGD